MSRIDAALHELRSLDDLAQRDTALTRLDARALVFTTAVFCVVVVSFDRYAVSALLPLSLYPLALSALGDLPTRPLLRKLAIAAPFALLVGLFNPLLDRAPLLAIGDLEISGGWISFASILLRFALTVGAALVLVAATGMHELCAALGRLGVPGVFTAQLLFLFRYSFVLGGEASRTVTAYELRSGGNRPRLDDFGALAGHGLLRAFERARRIHGAMLARGFDGEVRSMRPLRWTARDSLFVVGWCLFFLLVRMTDISQWFGHVVTGLLS
jgi:cobalt/nickel transport system permease protein